jgi:multidrug transporter EmrE-like cation transporter
MSVYLIGAGLINSVKPYCRKHLINSLETHEFMFLNTIIISILIISYLLYKKTCINDLYYKYTSLTFTQIASIVILSMITVFGTLMKLNMDKENNGSSTFMNGLLVKGVTSATIIFIGMAFFNEKYTWKTWLSIFMIAGGIYLIQT